MLESKKKNETRVRRTYEIIGKKSITEPSGGDLVSKISAIRWEIALEGGSNVVVVSRVRC